MKIKNYLPTTMNEIAKFSLTAFIMAMILFVYSILRGTKDALIIAELGAELISTLKLYGVLPMAIITMLIYSKLIDYLSAVKTFHLINLFIVGFFLFFDTVLYPNASTLHFDFSDLITQYPFLKYQLIMVANWTYSLFYIMSELWGSIMLSLMFWQLANQINTILEAKKYYPLFGFLGQIGLLTSGIMLSVFTNVAVDWKVSMHYINISVFASGILISLAFHILSKYVVGYESINGVKVKSKEKPGLIKSLKYVFSSKYIGFITLLIICYGVSINLVEGVWKKQVGTLFVDSSNIGGFTAKVQIYTSIATFLAMLLGSYMLKICNWRTAALFTPIVILVTGVPFFALICYKDLFALTFEISPTNLLLIAVIFGAAQNVLSKAIKYSFFDPTKEMSYIPLDNELKTKGKATADVIGGRLGKSGGAIIQWFMLSFIAGSTLTSLAPSLFAIFVIILIVWFFAVFGLYKKYTALTNNNIDTQVSKSELK